MKREKSVGGVVFREVEEETGIKDLRVVEGFREAIKYFFNYRGVLVSKAVAFFLCETKTKDVRVSEEHLGFEWLEYEDAMEKLEFRNSKSVLAKAHEFLGRRKIPGDGRHERAAR